MDERIKLFTLFICLSLCAAHAGDSVSHIYGFLKLRHTAFIPFEMYEGGVIGINPEQVVDIQPDILNEAHKDHAVVFFVHGQQRGLKETVPAVIGRMNRHMDQELAADETLLLRR